MTSLEFIEKEIDYYKQKKDKAVERYAFLIEHNGNYAQIQRAENERDAINNYLNNLQQIKNILEAWEIVDPKLTIEKGSIDYAYINIKDWHHHLTKEEFEKLEKVRGNK